ncbi:hypothetical protein R3W88_010465 [Solanum pinnatisectum]|uniref:(S)-2-hydroxy-acid oxidase n=1 Tax=Solanum pinnatisectum TaxID=50273 RepID=A0AAV9MGP5_9SOLN|nr:hypothetical protein R3W88_010465 [Solanum pinnatisectum]
MAGEPVNVNEFHELARKVLPKMYYDFFAGGAEDEYTLKENVEAFHRITIQPRILVDASRIDMSTVILSHKTSAPIILSPSAAHQLAHPEGEVATARGAAACNVIMGLSFMSTCTVEEVASSCNAVRFFQTYVYKRRDVTEFMVRQAENNGFRAIILTADTPRLGRREADIKNKMISFRLRNFEGLISTDVVSDIAWLKSITKLPILIKGVLNGEDAMKAIEAGVVGIIVSNHGARQLDYSPATISVLEEIGRPVIYGLAAKGESGVKQVIEMLKNELELTMALAGCCSVDDITKSHVKTEKERFLCKM